MPQLDPIEAQDAQFKIYRTVRTLDDMRPIIKTFMTSLVGKKPAGDVASMSFAILERIYYNIIGALPLAKELMFNQNIAVPLSHIYRSLLYEIVISYWLLGPKFSERIAKLNRGFIKKGYNRVLADEPNIDAIRLQELFKSWQLVAPDNFTQDTNGQLAINEQIKRITFDEICKELSSEGHHLKPLTGAYIVLSQQAHLSAFSRPLIYEKETSNARLFDFVSWATLRTSIFLIQQVDSTSGAVSGLEKILTTYPEFANS